MSSRWAYISRDGLGMILKIYCVTNPSDMNPSGKWIVVRKMAPDTDLTNLSESCFFYYEDKNAYRRAKINADEVARKYIEERENCCTIM